MVDFATYKTSTESATIVATAADADATVLYTCPAVHSATIDMLFISNNNSASKKVYVQFYHQDDLNYHYLLKAHTIAGNSAYNVLGNSLMHLHAGDKIVLYSETTNTMEATISLKEYYNPNR
mgnify:CR=1 FL=1|tara:strand:+ start:280 stop:645 length:366 start_codon:yes stop_codon:yes gene_type:complete